MGVSTGTSTLGAHGLQTEAMGLIVGTSTLGSGGLRTGAITIDAYAAHVARLQAIDPSGSYYTARDYTASTSQAGLFVDAFGGALTYDSPNVMASPTRVVDAQSGLVYSSLDGADDTAVGSAEETVDTYTAVFRSPPGQMMWSGYGPPHSRQDNASPREALTAGGTDWYPGFRPRSVRRNGAALSDPYDLAPITQWAVITIQSSSFGLLTVWTIVGDGPNAPTRLHLACLRKWPTAPSATAVAAAEQELASYYGPLIANGSN